MLSDYKSPYGIPRHVLQMDTDHWLSVEGPEGFRYFKASNWTYFEKDRATEITEAEFRLAVEEMHREINAEMARRTANGGHF